MKRFIINDISCIILNYMLSNKSMYVVWIQIIILSFSLRVKAIEKNIKQWPQTFPFKLLFIRAIKSFLAVMRLWPLFIFIVRIQKHLVNANFLFTKIKSSTLLISHVYLSTDIAGRSFLRFSNILSYDTFLLQLTLSRSHL